MQVADAFVRYLADTKDLSKAVGPGGPIDQAGAKSASTVGARFTSAFQKTSTAAGAVGGAMFVGAVGGATKFEDQLRTINTVAHLTDDQLSGVGKSILNLSKETGKTTDDLTAGFYDLVSAGIPADKAINVLRDSAKFATGALGTTGEAVDVVTSALNAYGLSADQSGKVTDIFAQAVTDGKVTAAELGASIAQIAPVAASAGVSLEEISAGFGILTAKGVPAAMAATQMRAAISALLTPNKQLNDLSAQTGINFAALAKDKGLAVALEELRKQTDKNLASFQPFATMAGKDLPGALKKYGSAMGLTAAQGDDFTKAVGKVGLQKALGDLRGELGAGDEGFAKALGSIEAYQFGLSATGDNADAFATELGKVTKASTEGGVAQGQYDERMKSATSRGAKLTAQLHALGVEIGGPFVDSVGPAVSALGGMGQGMTGIFNISRLVGGGLGAVVGKLAGILIPGLLTLIPAAAGAASSVGAAIAAAIPLGAILLPALLIAAVVAAIIFLVNNPEIVSNIATFVGGIVTSIVGFLSALPGALLDVFGGAFAAVAAAAPGFVLAMAIEILKLPFRILDLQVRLLEFFTGIATNILGGIAQLIANVVGFFLALPGRIALLLPQMLTFFAGIGASLGRAVSTFVGNIVGFFLAIPGRIAAIGGQIVSGIINGMASLPGKLVDTIASAFRGVRIDVGPFHISSSGVSIDLPNIQLPSFDVGSSFIPADMLAAVHKGEIIVPAKESEAIRSGRATLGAGGFGGQAASSGAQTTVNVYNPTPEPASTSTKRELQKLAAFGVLG